MAACCLVVVLESGLWFAVQAWPGGKWPLLAAVRILQACGCLAAAARFGGLDGLGLFRKRLVRGLIQGGIWSAGFATAGVAIYTGAMLFSGVNLLPLIKAQLPTGQAERLWLLAVGGIIGPVSEEFFFRGIVYGYLRRWGAGLAICGSTALFVSLHSVGGFPFNQLVGGLVFALAYEKSHSLATPIVIHVTGNLAIFSLSLLSA